MTTYEEVAQKIGLDEIITSRYVAYMRERWADEEALQCKTGYAAEWAYRFLGGYEFEASDSIGKAIGLHLEICAEGHGEGGSMHTEREAYDALIRWANDAGRRGLKLYAYAVIPPRTATEEYHVMLDARPMTSTSERWDA